MRFSVHAPSTQSTQAGAWRTGPHTNANANTSAVLSQTRTHAQCWTVALPWAPQRAISPTSASTKREENGTHGAGVGIEGLTLGTYRTATLPLLVVHPLQGERRKKKDGSQRQRRQMKMVINNTPGPRRSTSSSN